MEAELPHPASLPKEKSNEKEPRGKCESEGEDTLCHRASGEKGNYKIEGENLEVQEIVCLEIAKPQQIYSLSSISFFILPLGKDIILLLMIYVS